MFLQFVLLAMVTMAAASALKATGLRPRMASLMLNINANNAHPAALTRALETTDPTPQLHVQVWMCNSRIDDR